MLIDIIFLIIICIFLLRRFFGTMTPPNNSSKNTKKSHTKMVNPHKVEELIVDEELKKIDQEDLIKIAKDKIRNVWEVFHNGNLQDIKNLVNNDIYQNIDAKIRLYKERPLMNSISSIRIQSITKDEYNFYTSFHVITEIKDESKTYFNVENWSMITKKDSINWIINYTSSF
jgi:hypothetical protein